MPNPKDVADFLGVTEKGLFVFDQTYRPIPLTQTFIGVTEPNAMKRVNQFNELAYDKCVGVLNKGKQAMVFVHSRKDTVKTARALAEMAGAARKEQAVVKKQLMEMVAQVAGAAAAAGACCWCCCCGCCCCCGGGVASSGRRGSRRAA